MAYVGFWRRVLAALIDTLCVLAVLAPAAWLIYGRNALPRLLGAKSDLGQLLLTDVLPACVIVLFWLGRQATPGKMLVRARIVDAKSGASPGAAQCVIRYLGYLVSALPLCLGFLWVAFDKRKQGWHDKLAGTVVVRTQSASQSRALRKAS